MPRRCVTDPRLPGLLRQQDGVLARPQSLAMGLTARAIDRRLADDHWQVLLPGIYLTCGHGSPSRRQMFIAALLYAGPHSAIDGPDACRWHGVKVVPVDEGLVHVVEPWGDRARSTGFVVVRRSVAAIPVIATDRLRYVDAATAVVAAARRMTSERQVLAALSDALQRRVVDHPELVRAHVQGPPRNARLTDRALEQLGDGVASAPEADLRLLLRSSTALPPAEFNVWLRLPGGRVVCVDALVEGSAVVHETNGRSHHRRADLFEDMQERHDALTAAGFVVLHNPPRRIRREGRVVLVEIERCHRRYDGRGLPPGVLRLPPAEAHGRSLAAMAR